MLDCSIVPQNRKNRRNREERGTIWRAILVINLFVHMTPEPTWSFEHHSRLFDFYYKPFQVKLTTRSVLVRDFVTIACEISYVIIQNRFLRLSLECARMSEGISGCFSNRAAVTTKYPSKVRTIWNSPWNEWKQPLEIITLPRNVLLILHQTINSGSRMV